MGQDWIEAEGDGEGQSPPKTSNHAKTPEEECLLKELCTFTPISRCSCIYVSPPICSTFSEPLDLQLFLRTSCHFLPAQTNWLPPTPTSPSNKTEISPCKKSRRFLCLTDSSDSTDSPASFSSDSIFWSCHYCLSLLFGSLPFSYSCVQ